jgi:alpha-galactosidase/6-phospho-beta-glucosidase family protein
MPVKVTMIGGGSSSFVPPLIRSFIRSEVLGDAEVTLMDVNAERVKVMEDLAGRLIESEGSPLRAPTTSSSRSRSAAWPRGRTTSRSRRATGS